MHHSNLILSLLLKQIEDILAAATKILSDNKYSNKTMLGGWFYSSCLYIIRQ